MAAPGRNRRWPQPVQRSPVAGCPRAPVPATVAARCWGCSDGRRGAAMALWGADGYAAAARVCEEKGACRGGVGHSSSPLLAGVHRPLLVFFLYMQKQKIQYVQCIRLEEPKGKRRSKLKLPLKIKILVWFLLKRGYFNKRQLTKPELEWRCQLLICNKETIEHFFSNALC